MALCDLPMTRPWPNLIQDRYSSLIERFGPSAI